MHYTDKNITDGLAFAMKRDCPEMVYVFEAGSFKYVKIGRTRAIKQRMSNLQSGCPLPLRTWLAVHTPDAAKFESRLHVLFEDHRTHGEWFSLPGQDLDALIGVFYRANQIARGNG